MSDRPPHNDPFVKLRARAERTRAWWVDSDLLRREVRSSLLQYLRGLPRRELLRRIDELWLARLNTVELEELAQSVTNTSPADLPRGRRRGRPRALLIRGFADEYVLDVWRQTRLELREFKRLRREHHARSNWSPAGKIRSARWRRQALVSPIGRRLLKAKLFEEAFDAGQIFPNEIAARLLHSEACGIEEVRAHKLCTWRTLYNKLQSR